VDRVDLERRFKAWVASDDEEALGAMYDLLQASGTAAVADLAAVPPSLGKALDQLRGAIGDQLAARHAIGDDGVYDAMCTLAVACGQ
jgi:hypothetical protein